MSSSIRRMATRGKVRSGLNSRGNTVGPAQTTPKHRGGHGLRWLASYHDIEKADPDCRVCHGKGALPSKYAMDGSAKMLACKCVPIKAEEK